MNIELVKNNIGIRISVDDDATLGQIKDYFNTIRQLRELGYIEIPVFLRQQSGVSYRQEKRQ